MDVAGVGDPVAVLQQNVEVLRDLLDAFVPSYESGVATTTIGPPTTGAHVLDELWKDAWMATWRCTSAGTPGTWRQETAAVRAGEPGSGTIPTGYFIHDSTELMATKVHLGAYAWRLAAGPTAYRELTGLTGGGSANLDGVATVSLSVGATARFYTGTYGVVSYRLTAGTDAEASPTTIRPDDYASSTNEKVWKMVEGCIRVSGSLDFGLIASGSYSELTLAATGIEPGDAVAAAWPSALESGLVPFARVTSSGTLTVTLANVSGSGINPANQTFTFKVWKA